MFDTEIQTKDSFPAISGEADFFPSHASVIETFDPQIIQTDSERLQFKSGGDRRGVTRQLVGTRQWQDAFSGVVYIWQTREGELYIADGHQRLGLAQRLRVKGDGSPIHLSGYRFREADGWSVEKMRVYAAAKNIAEGGESTKPLDVAKLLRNGGPVEFLETYIPSNRQCYRHGKSLANLGDESFKLVLNGVIPESWGIAVGERVDDPKEQLAVIRFLKTQRPNIETVYDLIDEAVSSGFTNYKQTNLFGEEDLAQTLVAFRIAVFKHCSRDLKETADVLTGYLRKQHKFRACGDVMQREDVERARLFNQTMLRVIGQARRAGEPISMSLTEAAAHFKNTGSMDVAANFFMTALENFARPFMPHQEAAVAETAREEKEPEADLPMFIVRTAGQDGEQPGFF